MYVYPWDIDAKAKAKYLKKLKKPEDLPQLVRTVQTLYHNSFKVPFMFAFAILGCAAALVLGCLAVRVVRHLRSSPSSKRSGAVRKHFVDAPLLGSRHAEPLTLVPGIGKEARPIISLAVPLRSHTTVLFVLALLNFFPLVACYSPTSVKDNYYYKTMFLQIIKYFGDRTAVLAVAQLPLVILLSGRNSPVRMLTGVSFDVVMLYHRHVARWVVVQVVLHAIAYSLNEAVKDGHEGYIETMNKPYVKFGTAALVFVVAMVVQSLRVLRQKAYEVFVAVHIVFAALVLAGVWWHIALLANTRYALFFDLLWLAIGAWVFDRVARVFLLVALNTNLRMAAGVPFLSRASVSLVEDSNASLLHVRVFPSGATLGRALDGSSVMLHLPTVQAFVSHPFSVMAGGTDETGRRFLDLAVRPQAGMTRRLHERAINGAFECVALLEGPYSGDEMDLGGFEHVLLVTGGIGITHTLPIFTKEMRTPSSKTDAEKPAAQRTVEMVWCAKSASTFAVALDTLEREVASARASGSTHTRAKITLCVTSQSDSRRSSTLSEKKSSSDEEKGAAPFDSPVLEGGLPLDSIPQLLSRQTPDESAGDAARVRVRFAALAPEVQVLWSEGKPDVGAEIAQRGEAGSTLAIVACGPPALLDAARAGARGVGAVYEEAAYGW